MNPNHCQREIHKGIHTYTKTSSGVPVPSYLETHTLREAAAHGIDLPVQMAAK
jgi:hypothetical protein